MTALKAGAVYDSQLNGHVFLCGGRENHLVKPSYLSMRIRLFALQGIEIGVT